MSRFLLCRLVWSSKLPKLSKLCSSTLPMLDPLTEGCDPGTPSTVTLYGEDLSSQTEGNETNSIGFSPPPSGRYRSCLSISWWSIASTICAEVPSFPDLGSFVVSFLSRSWPCFLDVNRAVASRSMDTTPGGTAKLRVMASNAGFRVKGSLATGPAKK
ncbi:hypothetical protein BDP27DRAFT_1322098 [Rhodocollybia butyracea]|uniref:Uncharacterized protein n=1 Tax=Rhodocollybia butyracea TaxID=206335 RepID=A0A9P5U8W9_9AGAR|nr:hypothetical protein BDP27DRAFT_1322098 [Rhodocollybia butyracea]